MIKSWHRMTLTDFLISEGKVLSHGSFFTEKGSYYRTQTKQPVVKLVELGKLLRQHEAAMKLFPDKTHPGYAFHAEKWHQIRGEIIGRKLALKGKEIC